MDRLSGIVDSDIAGDYAAAWDFKEEPGWEENAYQRAMEMFIGTE